MLFADIVGSTRLITELGDERARVVLSECLKKMVAVVHSWGGVDVEARGDEIVSVFPEPAAAVEAAFGMVALLAAGAIEGALDRVVRLRIGFVHGSVIETAGTPFGATVHLAARVASLAKSGQVLTTKETLSLLDVRWQRASRFYDRRVLKGIPGEQEIHEILLESGVTAARRGRSSREDRSTQAVELRYRDSMVRVDVSRPRVELGRDSACDLRVEGMSVSRLHATVEWDGGRVRVDDLSTNGTRVEPVGATPILVHHRGAPLTGQGVLRLGGDVPDEQCALVAYRCLGDPAAPPESL